MKSIKYRINCKKFILQIFYVTSTSFHWLYYHRKNQKLNSLMAFLSIHLPAEWHLITIKQNHFIKTFKLNQYLNNFSLFVPFNLVALFFAMIFHLLNSTSIWMPTILFTGFHYYFFICLLLPMQIKMLKLKLYLHFVFSHFLFTRSYCVCRYYCWFSPAFLLLDWN